MQRILVSSNCQTGGIAAALRALSDDFFVDAVSAAEIERKDSDISEKMTNHDVWVTSTGDETTAQHAHLFDMVIRCPILSFRSFHPDIIYVLNLDNNSWTYRQYNSLIACWSYLNEIDVDMALKLFNRKTYEILGYFDLWPAEIESYRSYFKMCELDFDRFIRPVKRNGPFMHTSNHPKTCALEHLGKTIAAKIGLSEDLLDRSINIPDSFESYRWPVYPEIATTFGFSGSYEWYENVSVRNGLRGFLELAYKSYRTDGLRREAVRFHGIDHVVRPYDAYDHLFAPLVEELR